MSAPQPSTALRSVGRRRFLISGWPWRSAAYLVTTAPMALLTALPFAALSLPWLAAAALAMRSRPPLFAVGLLVFVGVLLIAGVGPLVAMPLAAAERRRLRLVDSRPTVRSGHRRLAAPTPWLWLRTRYAEPATWRELGYALLLVTVAPLLYAAVAVYLVMLAAFIGSPVLVASGEGPLALGVGQVTTMAEAIPFAVTGLALLPTIPYLAATTAGVHGIVARALLQGGPDGPLRAELVEVSRSRARLVDAFEAERRRIERDLHDGAQQRLISLTLQLGLARLDTPAGSPAHRNLTEAHDQAKQLMAELRELIRGIHPRLLTDRGLPAALGELADSSPAAVTVSADLPGRLPDHVEGTAYFVVAEALTNVAKHSDASAAQIHAGLADSRLTVEISDNGRGGADPGRGTGLTGLGDRVAVVGGRMYLSSPVGGPTLLRVELPCSDRSG